MAQTGKGVTAEVIEEKMQNPIKDHSGSRGQFSLFLTVSLNIETLFVHAVIPSRSYMTGKYTGEQE